MSKVQLVEQGVVSDEMVHAALAAVDPLYQDHLRNPLNGPKTAQRVEQDIARARKMIEAALAVYVEGAPGVTSVCASL